MKIWRFEHKESGCGPYNHSVNECTIALQLETVQDLYSDHPGPFTDIPSFDDADLCIQDYFFGFKSKEQLLKWFHRDTIKLGCQKYGMCIRVYEVFSEDIEFGERQVAFKHKSLSEKQKNYIKHHVNSN